MTRSNNSTPSEIDRQIPEYHELVSALVGMACQYLEQYGQVDGNGVSAGENTVDALERLGLLEKGYRIIDQAFDWEWIRTKFSNSRPQKPSNTAENAPATKRQKATGLYAPAPCKQQTKDTTPSYFGVCKPLEFGGNARIFLADGTELPNCVSIEVKREPIQADWGRGRMEFIGSLPPVVALEFTGVTVKFLDQPPPPPTPTAGHIEALRLARQCAEWHIQDTDDCGTIARRLISAIDAIVGRVDVVPCATPPAETAPPPAV